MKETALPPRIIHRVPKRRVAKSGLARLYVRGPRRHSRALCGLVTCLLLALGGQSSLHAQLEEANFPSASQEDYEIRRGDVLEIAFFNAPELNQTRTVGPDGTFNLTLIGSVRSTRRTLSQLIEEIETRYSSHLVAPEVTISIKEFSSLQIYLGGEVNQPGVIPFTGGLTLVQAIMNGGGFTPSARLDQVVLIRAAGDGPVGRLVDVKQILYKADFQNDIRLAPRDVIFVSRSRIANVNRFIERVIKNNLPIPFFLSLNPGR